MTGQPSPNGPKRLPGGRTIKREKRPKFATALDYAMAVINDNTVAAWRRDQMAIQVLRSTKIDLTAKPTGKKVQRTEAAHKAAEKFAIQPLPARQVVQ